MAPAYETGTGSPKRLSNFLNVEHLVRGGVRPSIPAVGPETQPSRLTALGLPRVQETYRALILKAACGCCVALEGVLNLNPNSSFKLGNIRGLVPLFAETPSLAEASHGPSQSSAD